MKKMILVNKENETQVKYIQLYNKEGKTYFALDPNSKEIEIENIQFKKMCNEVYSIIIKNENFEMSITRTEDDYCEIDLKMYGLHILDEEKYTNEEFDYFEIVNLLQ